jgi:uncharacterized membrane protein YbhN (UPF0104 family)
VSKSKWIKVISIAAFITIAVLLVKYIYAQKDDFIRILYLKSEYLYGIMGLSLLSPLWGFRYRKIAVEQMGGKIDLIDWFGMQAIVNLLSYFLPFRGGLALSAGYYKKKCGVSLSYFTSITAGGFMVGLYAVSMEILVGLLFLLLMKNRFPWILWIFAILLVILINLFIFFSRKYGEYVFSKLPFQKYTLPIVKGFIVLIENRKVLLKVIVITFISEMIHSLRMFCVYAALGNEMNFFLILIYTGIDYLSDIVSFLPGNLGVKEVLIGTATYYTGNYFNDGIMISLLIRFSGFLTYFLYSLIFIIPVYKRLKDIK